MKAGEKLYDVEAERAIIRVLVDEAGIRGATHARRMLDASHLAAGDFFGDATRAVYDELGTQLRRGEHPDLLSLFSKIGKTETIELAGGWKWLAELLTGVDFFASDSGFPGYCSRVRELAIRRKLVAIARDIANDARNVDCSLSDVLTRGPSELARVTMTGTGWRRMTEDVERAESKIIRTNEGEELPCFSSGFPALDDVIGGIVPELTFIGALPGVGKSAFLATLIRHLSKIGAMPAVFSLEDAADWLPFRYVAAESGVNQFALRYRKLSAYQWEQVGNGFQRVREFSDGVLIDDRERLTPTDVVQAARDAILNHGAKVVIVDHVGELKLDRKFGMRSDELIGEALQELRTVVKTYGVPLLCATHLRRRDGLNADTEPKLTDFAGAAAFEKMARVAFGLSRAPDSDVMNVTILKATNGKPGVTVPLRFQKGAALISSIEGSERNDTGSLFDAA